jgi:hypothetical protein
MDRFKALAMNSWWGVIGVFTFQILIEAMLADHCLIAF